MPYFMVNAATSVPACTIMAMSMPDYFDATLLIIYRFISRLVVIQLACSLPSTSLLEFAYILDFSSFGYWLDKNFSKINADGLIFLSFTIVSYRQIAFRPFPAQPGISFHSPFNFYKAFHFDLRFIS